MIGQQGARLELPAGRAREPNRMGPGRDNPGDQADGKAERLKATAGKRPQAPDPDNAGEGRFASQVFLAWK
jgi:hypothetical protein